MSLFEIGTDRNVGIPRPVGYGILAGISDVKSPEDHVHPIFSEKPTKAVLQNGWQHLIAGANDWSLRYFKDPLGIVRLSGIITPGNVASGTVLTILPKGYGLQLPSMGYLVPAIGTATGIGRLVIQQSGSITLAFAFTGVTQVHIDLTFEAQREVVNIGS